MTYLTSAPADSNFTPNIFTKAGLKISNYDQSKNNYWYVTSNGKVCVVLYAAAGGDYNNIDKKIACSSACPSCPRQ